MAKSHSFSKKLAVYKKLDGRCAYCGSQLEIETFIVEHVTPRCDGGLNNIDNLMPSCGPCNSSKGRKSVEQFRRFSAVKAVTGSTIFGQLQVDYLYESGNHAAIGVDPLFKFYFEGVAK